MRIDLPKCDFKNCKYYQDGNCIKQTEYDRCKYREFREEEIKKLQKTIIINKTPARFKEFIKDEDLLRPVIDTGKIYDEMFEPLVGKYLARDCYDVKRLGKIETVKMVNVWDRIVEFEYTNLNNKKRTLRIALYCLSDLVIFNTEDELKNYKR